MSAGNFMFVHDRDEAFTGLEAGIILVAFVVVASVFSFTILNAGFFATQQTESTAYNALQQAGSTPEILGKVHGLKGDGEYLGAIRFNVALAPGGDYIDFDKMILTLSTHDDIRTYDANVPLYDTVIDEASWGITEIKPSTETGDVVLEDGEVYTVYVNLASGEEIDPGEEFTLELTSPSTLDLIIRRSAPSQIDNVNILY